MAHEPIIKAREGRPRTYSDEQIAEVLRVARENPGSTARWISDNMLAELRVAAPSVLWIIDRYGRETP